MKKPQPAQSDHNRPRLSSTQADGDSPGALPDADEELPGFIGNYALDVHEHGARSSPGHLPWGGGHNRTTPPNASASSASSAALAAVRDARPGAVLEVRGALASPYPSTSLGQTEKETTTERHHATSPDPLQDQNQNIQDGQPDGHAEDRNRSVGEIATTLATSFVATGKKILLYSWLNVLLVFVPIGIAMACIPNTSDAVVFSMNAVAIVPLAGLLAFATESVAHRMGDSIGALLNITFGNAVELIIFIIALAKNEIRIVQASLLGSILSNLLLILGMGFLLGGLRFREQIYNSTVTQMSACLLSLSVISLVLPTAFHASFSDTDKADRESLKISRGTSVILLIVYGIYLLFQLKSHAYMYESTPQYLIDEEAEPGPAAAWLDSSSSDDSSSSSSDSDSSGRSRDTMKKRMRRVMRAGRRRKSSVASMDTADIPLGGSIRTPSFGTATLGNDESGEVLASRIPATDANEAVIDEDDVMRHQHKKHHHRHSLRRHRHKSKKLSRTESTDHETLTEDIIPEYLDTDEQQQGDALGNGEGGSAAAAACVADAASGPVRGETRRVDFAIMGPGRVLSSQDSGPDDTAATAAELATARRAFNLRAMSLRPVAKSLAPTVFTQAANSMETPVVPSGPIPRVRYGIRRTNSLPDRLNHMQFRAPGAMLPAQMPAAALSESKDGEHDDDGPLMLSRRAAVVMLLVTTGLVAACAEFMVASINGMVATSSVGEAFIGLIILPIVGNAAEHVTAVTVAMKNKMDLAIGVAVGSSIQIALFTTPLVVILGWIMDREMSLYFTLFETVSLFVSAFIVNFLVLDGRSNYLEGALLCATYVIISLVAFFYPDADEVSSWGR